MDLTSILSHPAWTGGAGALMVIVTGLLVVVTWQLTKTTKNQTAFLEQQTALFERQQKHEVKMGSASITGGDGKGNFGGFFLTNVGIPAVTIVGAQIASGIPVTDTQTAGRYLGLGWTKKSNGEMISDFQPPHRLQSGDRITVLYNLDKLATYLDSGQRVRHECQDSLGNTYVSDWIDYFSAPNSINHHDTPGEGFREPRVM